MKQELIQQAIQASEQAYAPYSSFHVGAAVATASGEIFMGCNVENVSYGLTNCAERTALFTAIAAGSRQFAAMAIYGPTTEPISPCGACRQVLVELCEPNMPIYLVSNQGEVLETTVSDLLPGAFSKEALAHARTKSEEI